MDEQIPNIYTVTRAEARHRLEILYDRQAHGILTTREADEITHLFLFLQEPGHGEVDEEQEP